MNKAERIAVIIETLRSQRDFFLTVGEEHAANHCEQRAIGWQGDLREIERVEPRVATSVDSRFSAVMSPAQAEFLQALGFGVKTPATVEPVPNKPKTPVSNFRIPPELKAAAQVKAHERGESLTDVVVKALERYVRSKQ